MNNLLYNLINKLQQPDGPDILWVSFVDLFIQRLNFCVFAFIWERGKFDENI